MLVTGFLGVTILVFAAHPRCLFYEREIHFLLSERTKKKKKCVFIVIVVCFCILAKLSHNGHRLVY